MKYLTLEQSIAALSLAKAIEQWLPHVLNKNYTMLRWLRIDKTKDRLYIVQYIECFDDGGYDFTDIYEFSPINPDEPLKMNSFESIQDALDFAVKSYHADLHRFVSAGMIQEEYKSYLINRT